jgi:hypothetical protein
LPPSSRLPAIHSPGSISRNPCLGGNSPYGHSPPTSSRLTTASVCPLSEDLCDRLSGDSASYTDVEPQRYLPTPKAHHARCAPTLDNAGPVLNRPSDFGIGSPRHLRSWRLARLITQRSVQVSLELFRRRRARRRRLLPRSPSGRRALSPRIQLKQIAVRDRG